MREQPSETPIVPDLSDQTALLESLRAERRRGKKVVAFAIGTRPEVIKIAPILQALAERSDSYIAAPIITGQHPAAARMLRDDFGIQLSVNLGVLRIGQSLNQLAGRLFFSAHDLTTIARVYDVHAELGHNTATVKNATKPECPI